MRALLDTNILIHREASVVVRENIGVLFNWLDRLQVEKCVHPVSIEEINKHADPRVRQAFNAKLASYQLVRVLAPLAPEVQTLINKVDATDNDRNDSKLLNELFAHRVDLVITEDQGIRRKAEQLGIADQVFTIDAFLEKATAENPELLPYKIPVVKKVFFGEVDIGDTFFDSFRADYPGFGEWFNRKSQEPAYVSFDESKVVAFLYLKVEDEREPYSDIDPRFPPRRRLKIGTLKVELNGFKLGERFVKIMFDNAIKQRVDEVYVTIFSRSPGQERLINLLEEFGFSYYGLKHNPYGDERVYVRDMKPSYNVTDPRLSFPYVSKKARVFLVPIYPEYHTQLLPDSILNTESPDSFVEERPHSNAIHKVYVSRSVYRDLQKGDVIVFYRTGGKYLSVVTTLGIVQDVHVNIPSETEFVRLCRKKSVFSDDALKAQWRYRSFSQPFIVEFLYAYSFPKRPNLAALIEAGVINDIKSAPRGFERISDAQFATILKLAQANPRIIVN